MSSRSYLTVAVALGFSAAATPALADSTGISGGESVFPTLPEGLPALEPGDGDALTGAMIPLAPTVIAVDWALPDDGGGYGLGGQTSALPSSNPTTPGDPASAIVGPQFDDPSVAAVPVDRTGHVPREFATHSGFFEQAGSIKTELAVMAVYVGAQSIPKFFKDTTSFHFKDEGWFGKNTHNVGMDKLTHAYNTYLIAEILHSRLHRNTGGSEGDALTAGILAAGLMALNEMSDAIEPDSGYSMQDITMNVAGAAFSVLRNTVPGMKEKVAFKIEVMPNDQIYSRTGKKHYEQQRFMFSLKGAGFKELDNSALRYLDLQVGYYASDFLNSDRERGIEPKQHLFVGVGLNLGELLFGKSQSKLGKAAHSALDYFQFPYTSVRTDTQGRISY